MKSDYWKYDYFFIEVEILFVWNEAGYSLVYFITRGKQIIMPTYFLFFIFLALGSHQLFSC